MPRYSNILISIQLVVFVILSLFSFVRGGVWVHRITTNKSKSNQGKSKPY